MAKKKEPSKAGTVSFNQIIDFNTFEKVDNFLEKVKEICLKQHLRHFKGDVVSKIFNDSEILKLTPEEYVEQYVKK